MFWLLEVLMCHSQSKLVGVGKRCKQKKIPQQVAKKFIKHQVCSLPIYTQVDKNTLRHMHVCTNMQESVYLR